MDPPSIPEAWHEIEQAESYLVNCMFEDAATQASSILLHLCDPGFFKTIKHVELYDMMESASMVLVQSSKELGRASELFDMLKSFFGSVTAIPVEVVLVGSCIQISEGCFSGLQLVLEEFLGRWTYLDSCSYVQKNVEIQGTSEGSDLFSILESAKYVDVAEVYAVTLLGLCLRNTEAAIKWVEKAELPEEKRQYMLEKLQSVCATEDLSSLLRPGTPEIEERGIDSAAITAKSSGSEKCSNACTAQMANAVANPTMSKCVNHKYSLKQLFPCLWWYRTIKFGNACLVLSRGRVVFWSTFSLLIFYILRIRGAALKRTALKHAASAKKVLNDAFQLAFSFQVNPLASVQPLPTSIRGVGGT